MTPQCEYVKRDGSRCRGRAMHGHRYCGPHVDKDPSSKSSACDGHCQCPKVLRALLTELGYQSVEVIGLSVLFRRKLRGDDNSTPDLLH